ncbi:hypothetical protein [Microbispora sp. NBRC 16548]|uniref:hypothetical protein n=1 Tax=Microbispora sp. NBRC 16548 TaxID=3030994 RepID=UPI00249FB9EE|nr:hypothetical protein [Microbispora sp. NBRC 16548]GLX07137.1 hypothetical protein Misp03_40630 [Microbispora sp. NBRC 16548]
MRALTRLILPMAVVSAMTSGCGAFDPRLIVNGGSGTDGPDGEVMLHDTVARRPYSLGGWDMCLDRPGSVTITRVELIKPYNDIVLQAFSSRPHTGPMLGNAEKPLTELGFPARSPAVTVVCEENPLHTELALQYAKTGDATAGADGVRITYTSAGRQRTVDFSLRVLLCAPGDTERCREAYEGLSTTSDDD